MLYHILYPLHVYFTAFNVFRYITFRTIYAAITALCITLFLGPWFIKKIKKMQFGQIVRDDGPKSHLKKTGTPSMGGILITGAISISTLLWADLKNIYIWICLIILVGFSAIGFRDDWLKIKKKDPKGLQGRWKLLIQALLISICILLLISTGHWDTRLNVPFFKNFQPDLGLFYFIFAYFVIAGSSNAVNLTDGLDGLATGPFVVSAAVYTLFCYLAGHSKLAQYLQLPYVPGVGEISIFCGAMVGAGLGFLWYNSYPAEIFMGDVGSLAMGGALGTVAIISKQEILLAIVGGVFVAEAISVMIQVGYFKITKGKRIFRMAPLHHHFEMLGWPEPKIIVRFWIISVLLGLVAISTLKLR